jgi:hypothetical protein
MLIGLSDEGGIRFLEVITTLPIFSQGLSVETDSQIF